MADSSLVSSVKLSPSNSGTGYSKTFGVLHDIECPPGASWAESLGGPSYMQNPANKVSVQYIVDADSVVQTGTESTWCWGAGPYANRRSIQIEQAGYASFTKAQWLGSSSAIGSTYTRPNGAVVTYTAADAASMASQFKLLARLIADISKRHGWSCERASDSELHRASSGENIGKWVRHADVSRVLGGTGHTDPGPNYPFDELMAAARGESVPSNPPVTPTPAPPTPSTPASSTKITGTTYTVKSGDTLSSISSRSGVSVENLVKFNNIGNPNTINVGQVLKLTGTTTPAPKPTPAPVTPAPVAPKFPLPAGSYFGPKSGPANSVSGYYSHNADLKVWQTQMNTRGWHPNLTVDGLYGDKTAIAARFIQQKFGVSQDGLIGPTTWALAWKPLP